MSLTGTTLSSAKALSDNFIVVASATGFSAGYRINVDGEIMYVGRGYVSGTTIPVLTGQEGTQPVAHAVTSAVKVGSKDDTEWGTQSAQSVAQILQAGRPQRILSYSASGAIDLPLPGSDNIAVLNAVSTTVLAMTLAVPTKAMDGCKLRIVSRNGTGAHTITLAAGLNGAGSSYDAFTFPAGPVMIEFMALNELWYVTTCPAWTGTVTLLVGGIA